MAAAAEQEQARSALQLQRSQTMKNYALMLEYQHLQNYAPGGVYVMSRADDVRTWDGTIFVRRGLYRNGIFKFRVELPPEYNAEGTWPEVTFASAVFHPLVDAQSGRVNLRFQFPAWDPSQHYVVSALTFLKRLFYMRPDDFAGAALEAPCNAAALRMLADDREAYLRRVEECVAQSQANVYVNDESSALRFTEHVPAHDAIAAKIFGTADDDAAVASASLAEAAGELQLPDLPDFSALALDAGLVGDVADSMLMETGSLPPPPSASGTG